MRQSDSELRYLCFLFALQNQRFLKSRCSVDSRRRKIAFNRYGDLKMIGEKLRKLGEYIERIDEIKSIELLDANIKKIEKELEEFPAEQLELGSEFNKDIFRVIAEYSKKSISNYVIIYELYNLLIGFSRKSMIETRAESLGIDRKMYKDEMNLLFKGKSI